MEIVKQVNNKTLVKFNEDAYLAQCDYRLIKEYGNSFAIKDFHAWQQNYKRTARSKGNYQYVGKNFIKLLNSLITK